MKAKKSRTPNKIDVSPKKHLASTYLQFWIGSILIFFWYLSLFSYCPTDNAWFYVSSNINVSNWGSIYGAWLSDFSFCFLGYFAYLLPLLLGYLVFVACFRPEEALPVKIVGLFCLGVALLICCENYLPVFFMPIGSGGIFGNCLKNYLLFYLGNIGMHLSLFVLFFVGLTGLLGPQWLKIIDYTGGLTLWCFKHLTFKKKPRQTKENDHEKVNSVVDQNVLKTKKRPTIQTVRQSTTQWSFPPVDLLDAPNKKAAKEMTEKDLEKMSRNVELRLRDFGINVKVVGAHTGPVVTRFELELAAGTKVSRISTLSKDLARSLSVPSVRIVEVIPGKSVVGLELPNAQREIVRLREIIASEAYEQSKAPLNLALGKDISGYPVIVDLAKMPHLLVAGTTGSGKSVCVNALILSLLYKYTPQELKILLVDPKMLELSVYADIPHLLVPVITNMKEVPSVFHWCILEMEKRYCLMSELGVRNLSGYNYKIREARKNNQPILDPLDNHEELQERKYLTELPYLVLIADEYADMMMVVGKKIEELIARLAQKARAAGIHLILATQRPSVDVVTGLIKANIPSRIAFQVSSKIDSRTILDQSGAEQLLGYGDMLYLAPGSGMPIRVHGAFVGDDEVHRVVNALKMNGKPEYLSEIVDGISEDFSVNESIASSDDPEKDPLYDQAVQMVLETNRASTSNIQRRFKIGYNRAARMIDAMEVAGIVGPLEKNGARRVLINKN